MEILFTAFLLGILLALVRGSTLKLIIISAFSLRLGLVLVDVYHAPLPGSGVDTVYFYTRGVSATISSVGDAFRYFEFGSRLYVWFVGLLFSVFGDSAYIAQSVNAFVAALSIYLFSQALIIFFNRRDSYLFTMIFGFWPSYVLYSSLLLRESFVTFFIMLGLLSLCRWYKTRDLNMFVWVLIGFVSASALHSGMILCIPGSILFVAVVLIKERRTKKSKKMKSVLGMFVLALVFAVGLASGVGMQKFRKAENLDIDFVAAKQISASRSRAAYLQDAQTGSFSALLSQTPLRMVYFFFSPFPWSIRGGADLVGGVDAIFYGMLFIIAIKRARNGVGVNVRRAMLLMFLFSSIALAVGTSNYGTAVRHRAKLLPFLLLSVPVFVASKVNERARERTSSRSR